jgi:hypothetical protein
MFLAAAIILSSSASLDHDTTMLITCESQSVEKRTKNLEEKEGGDERLRGPSADEIPRAFPPFLEKRDVISVPIGWKEIEGRTPSASLIADNSCLKISTMSAISVALF